MERESFLIEGINGPSVEVDKVAQSEDTTASEVLEAIYRGWDNNTNEHTGHRKKEIEQQVIELLKGQNKEYSDLIYGQEKEVEQFIEVQRSGLRNRFMNGLREYVRTGLDVVPEVQKLIGNLGIGSDLVRSPFKRNIIDIINMAGGVHTFSVEKGIIDYNGPGNKFKRMIGVINNYLQDNEEIKTWLQDVIRRAVSNK